MPLLVLWLHKKNSDICYNNCELVYINTQFLAWMWMGYFGLRKTMFFLPASENFAILIHLMYISFKMEIVLNIWD